MCSKAVIFLLYYDFFPRLSPPAYGVDTERGVAPMILNVYSKELCIYTLLYRPVYTMYPPIFYLVSIRHHFLSRRQGHSGTALEHDADRTLGLNGFKGKTLISSCPRIVSSSSRVSNRYA